MLLNFIYWFQAANDILCQIIALFLQTQLLLKVPATLVNWSYANIIIK